MSVNVCATVQELRMNDCHCTPSLFHKVIAVGKKYSKSYLNGNPPKSHSPHIGITSITKKKDITENIQANSENIYVAFSQFLRRDSSL